MEIITSHLNADFDAFASMVAASKLYPRAEVVFSGAQEKKLRDFIDLYQPLKITRLRDLDIKSIRKMIIVDTNSPDRIGPLAEALSNPDISVHIYDHHPREEESIRGEIEVFDDTGSTTTMFVEMLRKAKHHPSTMEATIMALGIYEETGSLLFPSTTERDLVASAYLLKRGASLKIVSEFMRMGFGRLELELLNELVTSSTEHMIHGVRVKTAKAFRDEYVGDAALLAHSMMDMEDIDALVLIIGMEDKVVLIGRSRTKELDVSKVMEEFGGGGHPTAAAATIKDMPLELVEEKVVGLLSRSVSPARSASSVMTTPVITVNSGAKIRQAEDMMTRYSVNALPVLRRGKYVALITREIVEKALFHGFGNSPAMDFATTDAAVVHPDTPIRDVERTMIEQNQRFMPVLKDGHIAGAITRTDILRVIYEDFLRRSRIYHEEDIESSGAARRRLTAQMKNKFPKEVFELLALAGTVADEMGYGAFIVGGSVRDLLRGEENLDIDLVIEGDAIAFSKELGRRIHAKTHSHKRFGTARILLDDLKLDVATARTEYYESPAALPKVETSSLKKDLYRRDFTINTLAIKLNPSEFGLLIDFFGGQRDLKEKAIRVLHNLSFVEDPTRAFRAVRFAERFGFRISRHTENLIKSSMKMELFDRLSGTRLYEELLLIIYETEPVNTLKRLDEYDLLSVIHPGLRWSQQLQERLESVQKTLQWFELSFTGEETDRGILYIMGLVSVLDTPGKKTALARLAVVDKVGRRILKGISASAEMLAKLPAEDPADIYDALSGADIETLLFSMALATSEERQKEISRFLIELRNEKPLLSGNDLKTLGIPQGPVYTDIMKDVLHERLRGNLKSKEDELEFVKARYLSPSTSCMS